MTIIKSNSIKYFFIFILATIGIFFYWIISQPDNSENITKNISPPIEIPVVKKERTKHVSIMPEQAEDIDNKAEALEKQRQAYQTNVKKSINQALMFKTPESIMKVIIHYQSEGDDEKANEYINLLLKKFPDYNMDS